MNNRFQHIQGLVLEGGGALGIAHVGALSRLQELNCLPDFKYLAGSSVGSVIIGALAVGATAEQIKNMLNDLDLTLFRDDSRCCCANLYRLNKHFGWYKGNYISNWYADIIEQLTANAKITLAEIYNRYEKYLIITAYNVDYRQTEYYTPESHPDLPLVEAVRRSSGIPLYFKTVETTPGENGDPIDTDACLIIDGGWLDNYPMHKLDEYLAPEQVLGIKLYTDYELHEAITNDKLKIRPDNLAAFLFQIVEDARNQAMKLHIHTKDWLRTIKVDVGELSSTDFNMTVVEKQTLFENGQKAVDNFLNPNT